MFNDNPLVHSGLVTTYGEYGWLLAQLMTCCLAPPSYYLYLCCFLTSAGSVSGIHMRPLHWRHNEHDGVSNSQPHDCLLNPLFRCRSKKTSKLRVTGLCAGNSPRAGEFPAQMASNAENVSIWWRHHAISQRIFKPLFRKISFNFSIFCQISDEPMCSAWHNNLPEIKYHMDTRATSNIFESSFEETVSIIVYRPNLFSRLSQHTPMAELKQWLSNKQRWDALESN